MMETAGEIYGVNHLTCTHGTRGIHRAAGDEGGSLVHQVEDWVVLAAEPIVARRSSNSRSGAPRTTAM